MADVYEVTLDVRLSHELTERQIAELRRHVGLGPRPERLGIVTAFPVVVVDDGGTPFVGDEPRALLGQIGEAWRIGGELGADLDRDDGGHGRLTARQEMHAEELGDLDPLLLWSAERCAPDDGVDRSDLIRVLGTVRFYESDVADPLCVVGGVVRWP